MPAKMREPDFRKLGAQQGKPCNLIGLVRVELARHRGHKPLFSSFSPSIAAAWRMEVILELMLMRFTIFKGK